MITPWTYLRALNCGFAVMLAAADVHPIAVGAMTAVAVLGVFAQLVETQNTKGRLPNG